MKNKNLKNLVRKSDLLEQAEEYYIMESSQLNLIKGGNKDGTCPVIIYNGSCTPNNGVCSEPDNACQIIITIPSK